MTRPIEDINADLQRELDSLPAAQARRIMLLLVELSEAKAARLFELLRPRA